MTTPRPIGRIVRSHSTMTTTLLVGLLVGSAPAAEPYAEGWTKDSVNEAIDSCTEQIVKGAWANTKKAQGVDPKMKMTPEIRKQLAPQIAKFRELCKCTVTEAAKKFGRKKYETDPEAVGSYAQELVKNGTCTPPAPAQER